MNRGCVAVRQTNSTVCNNRNTWGNYCGIHKHLHPQYRDWNGLETFNVYLERLERERLERERRERERLERERLERERLERERLINRLERNRCFIREQNVIQYLISDSRKLVTFGSNYIA